MMNRVKFNSFKEYVRTTKPESLSDTSKQFAAAISLSRFPTGMVAAIMNNIDKGE